MIAVVAGAGRMPPRIMEGMREAGRGILLVAIKGITPPEFSELADETVWIEHPRLGRIKRLCRKRGVTEITMCGKVAHSRVFKLSWRHMDWAAVRLWWGLRDLRANTLLGGVVRLFEGWGIRFISTLRYLGKYIAKKGVLTKTRPSASVLRDMEFGRHLAKELGRNDIGQTVVVKNGAVVALEAMEGTDRCLKRAGLVAGSGCVVVKMSKPCQDQRFDVPVIGVDTIELLHQIEAAGLAIEAGGTIVIDPETIALADQYGILIIAL